MKFDSPLHILVVDDEEMLREVTVMLLEEAGVTCESACGGREALEKVRLDPTRFHGAVIDFSMPEMTGVELVVQLRLLRPNFPILVVSGLRMVREVEAMVQKGELQFLSKPFTETELYQAVKRWQG